MVRPVLDRPARRASSLAWELLDATGVSPLDVDFEPSENIRGPAVIFLARGSTMSCVMPTGDPGPASPSMRKDPA